MAFHLRNATALTQLLPSSAQVLFNTIHCKFLLKSSQLLDLMALTFNKYGEETVSQAKYARVKYAQANMPGSVLTGCHFCPGRFFARVNFAWVPLALV